MGENEGDVHDGAGHVKVQARVDGYQVIGERAFQLSSFAPIKESFVKRVKIKYIILRPALINRTPTPSGSLASLASVIDGVNRKCKYTFPFTYIN